MPLKHHILEQLKAAMKSKDEITVSTLRMLISAVKNEEISKTKREDGLNDDEVTTVIARQIKQRKDAIEQFAKGGRADLVEKEKAELVILQSFMPEQLGEEEIRAIAGEVIAGGASGFGAIMSAVMGKVKGKADGGTVKKIVEKFIL